MGRPVRVYLLDDVEALRELARFGLEEDDRFRVVGDASNPIIGLPEIEALQPDAVLLDLSMPEMDGLEAIPHILAGAPSTAIVVFTGFTEERIGRDVIGLGAHDYVAKGTPIEGVRDAISKAVARIRRPLATSGPETA